MIRLPNQMNWPILMFYQELVNWGIQEDKLSEAFGLNLKQLKELDTSLSLEQIRKLAQLSQALSGRIDIGLVLGINTKYDANNSGIILNIALNSPTVREFLLHLEKYSFIVKNILSFHLIEKDDVAKIQFEYLNIDIVGLPIIEFYLTGLTTLLKYITREQFKPKWMNFQYPAPSYIDTYHNTFKTQLKFAQAESTLAFDRKYMDLPTPNPVSIINEVLSMFVDKYLENYAESTKFQDKIRTLIVEHLHTDDVSIEAIARQLKMDRRTIYQKLKDENTSFKQILLITRKQMAIGYLNDISLTIESISSLLGYSESSSFKRAFKRWFGINPGEYRKRLSRAE